MNSTLLMLAEISPLPVLISIMKEACQEYENNPTEKNSDKVLAMAHVIALKAAIGESGSSEKLIKELEEGRKAIEFFKPKQN